MFYQACTIECNAEDTFCRTCINATIRNREIKQEFLDKKQLALNQSLNSKETPPIKVAPKSILGAAIKLAIFASFKPGKLKN